MDSIHRYSGRRSALWLCAYGMSKAALTKEPDEAPYGLRYKVTLTEGTILFQDSGGNEIIWFRLTYPPDKPPGKIVGEITVGLLRDDFDELRPQNLKEGWRVYRDIVVPDELLQSVRDVAAQQRCLRYQCAGDTEDEILAEMAQRQAELDKRQAELNQHWPVLACLVETALPYIEDSSLPAFLQGQRGSFGGGRRPRQP